MFEKQIQKDYKVINMDQWMGFYRFCNEVCFLTLLLSSRLVPQCHQLTKENLQISFPEMTEYNPELAWPLVLDNFVEWIREKQA